MQAAKTMETEFRAVFEGRVWGVGKTAKEAKTASESAILKAADLLCDQGKLKEADALYALRKSTAIQIECDCKKVCPKCSLVKCFDAFGYRKDKGVKRLQPWCTECRAVREITTNKSATRRMYMKHFPDDTNNHLRAWRFMVRKLLKKGLKITDEARAAFSE